MKIYEEVKLVEKREDFVNFVRMLGKDSKDKPEQWENVNIADYLEAIGAWVNDMDGYYKNNGLPVPHNIDWNFFANVLYAGKIYE